MNQGILCGILRLAALAQDTSPRSPDSCGEVLSEGTGATESRYESTLRGHIPRLALRARDASPRLCWRSAEGVSEGGESKYELTCAILRLLPPSAGLAQDTSPRSPDSCGEVPSEGAGATESRYCPAWIRTKTPRSRVSCATVTLRGTG